jgi:hypothetical protein
MIRRILAAIRRALVADAATSARLSRVDDELRRAGR